MASLYHSTRARLAAAHLNHRRIARGALWTAALVIVSKALVALREVAIAWRYGVSAEVDAYNFAFALVTWAPSVVAGVCTAVLVPRIIRVLGNRSATDEFFLELNGAVFLLGCGITLATLVALPWLTEFAGSSSVKEHARKLAIQLSPLAFLTIWLGYYSARLQAAERFAFSVQEALPAVFAVPLLILMPIQNGTQPLIIGMLLGALVSFCWLGRMASDSGGAMWTPRFSTNSSQWRGIIAPFAAMAVTQALVTSTTPVDQVFAATLGEGAVAVLGYANRIINLATAMAYLVMGRALLPVLASAIAEGEYNLARRHSLTWSVLLLIAGSVVATCGWFVAPFIVHVMLERGAFTSNDTIEVSSLLRLGLIQLPAFFSSVALVQWLAATSKYGVLMTICAVSVIAKIMANMAFMEHFGLSGIMFATALMHAVMWLMLIVFLWKSSPPEKSEKPFFAEPL